MVPQIEVIFVRKTTCCQSARQLLCLLAQCSRRRRWFCVRGILYKGILACSPRCSRRLRIDEAHNETRVDVDHCAASCLEKLCGPSEPFAPGVCLRELTSHFGVHSRISSCPTLVRPLLRNTHDCAAVTLHTSGYCTIRQSSFTKADDSAPFKHRNLLKFHSLSSTRHSKDSVNVYTAYNHR
ncbi:hypothetical protein TNCV_4483111 [Trichonephila clavipes]|nr:hypothetical protein TNCV_4483111 [Trichonephila clavipes]